MGKRLLMEKVGGNKMKKKALTLGFVWGIRCKLWAEGSKLRAKGSKLWAEGSKLWAEGSRLRAKGSRLRAKGSRLWAEAILEVYGNIKFEWKNFNKKKNDYECHLETGEIFKPI